MLNETELLKLLLPEFLIDHFEIVKFEEENKVLHIYFEKKIRFPKDFLPLYCNQKDFCPKLP